MKEVILEMKNIVKTFPGVRALDNVNVKIEKGTIHSLVGENGAGKSTLMNVLSGVYPYGTYEGDIIYNGEICKFKDIKESETKGIVIIHQELALIPYLSIMENIFLGNEQADKGVINWSKARFEAKKLMKIVGLHEDPEAPVNTIGVGKQQLVEIAKALSKNVELLILDEPTAGQDFKHYTEIMEFLCDLNKQGITIIMITHDMHLMLEYTNRAIVLCEGEKLMDDSSYKVLTNNEIIKKANLKETSLYELAVKADLKEPKQFVKKFIDYDRRYRKI